MGGSLIHHSYGSESIALMSSYGHIMQNNPVQGFLFLQKKHLWLLFQFFTQILFSLYLLRNEGIRDHFDTQNNLYEKINWISEGHLLQTSLKAELISR